VTIRPRAVRALRDARARLRDVAAASHAVASAASDRTRTELEEEETKLQDFLDDAAEALITVRTVHELDELDDITGVYELAVVDAAARHASASAATEASAEALRGRARQLRQAERLVDRVDGELASREARVEQRSHDDMSARRGIR
jgi:flagellar biosynthesis chaperone FliJ